MANKDKTVTLEGLKALHDHNKNAYMPVTYQNGSSVKRVSGNVHFTDIVEAHSLIIGDVELSPTEDGLEIRFLNG